MIRHLSPLGGKLSDRDRRGQLLSALHLVERRIMRLQDEAVKIRLSLTEFGDEARKIVAEVEDARLIMMQIATRVAELTGVSLSSILSPDKHANIAHARQVAMYLIRQTVSYSFPKIGAFFDRDHSTVVVSWQIVDAEMKKRPGYAATIRHWQAEIAGILQKAAA